LLDREVKTTVAQLRPGREPGLEILEIH
jgi:hypothetical protein